MIYNLNFDSFIQIYYQFTMHGNLMNEYLLQIRLGDPDIVSDPSEYQKLAQSVSDLGEVYLA